MACHTNMMRAKEPKANMYVVQNVLLKYIHILKVYIMWSSLLNEDAHHLFSLLSTVNNFT